MELIDAPTYSRIKVTDLGSTDGIEGITASVGDTLLLWTTCTNDENPFVAVRIRGVVDASGTLSWLPDDAQVEIAEQTRYAGKPEDLVKQAKPMKAPEGSKGAMQSEEGWPDLVWLNDSLHSALTGWTDAQIATEEILCALTFAPDVDDLRPMLLAGLKAQYTKVVRDPRTNPPERYPWRNGTALDLEDLDHFRGR